MAWREVGKRGIISLVKASSLTSSRDAVVSVSLSTLKDVVKSLSASIRCIREFSISSAIQDADDCKFLIRRPVVQ